MEATKAAAGRENLAAAGLADLVEIRVGDALETLKDGIGGDVDLVHLDGASNLYVPVLKQDTGSPRLALAHAQVLNNELSEVGDVAIWVSGKLSQPR